MTLTKDQVKDLTILSRWFSTDIDTLLHKFISHQIWICNEVRLECSREGKQTKKYELAMSLKLLE